MALWFNDPACLRDIAGSIPSPAKWVEDPVLPQLWRRSQRRLRFNPWPGNFRMQRVGPNKKKKSLGGVVAGGIEVRRGNQVPRAGRT